MEKCCIDFPVRDGVEGLKKKLEKLPRRNHIIPLEIFLHPNWRAKVGDTITVRLLDKETSIPVGYRNELSSKVEVCYKKWKEHPKKHNHANGKDPLVNKHS